MDLFCIGLDCSEGVTLGEAQRGVGASGVSRAGTLTAIVHRIPQVYRDGNQPPNTAIEYTIVLFSYIT